MDNSEKYTVNPKKQKFVEYAGKKFACYAVRTATITSDDKLDDVVKKYLADLEKDDVVFMSEKMVACTQNRAIPMDSIKPGFFARTLSRFVTRSSRGIGLSIPETMQCAIDECGLFRILLASFVSAIGKLFGVKGWFYKVAGYRAAAVDGPCSYTLPPYNHYVVLAPKDPDKVAAQASKVLGGNTVLIADINDFGCEILGASSPNADLEMYKALLKQNPLGQSSESTPIGILRAV